MQVTFKTDQNTLRSLLLLQKRANLNFVVTIALFIYFRKMSAKTIASLTHVQRVRLLYKTCLRLHRGLPTQMQILGDAYVKDEFRRHKEADPVQTATFMEAWAVSL